MTRGFAAAIAIAASIGAGIIHLALGPAHLEELGALGWGFYVAAVLQIGWAVAAAAVVARRNRGSNGRVLALPIAGIAINVAILVAWATSRTIGLPAGELPWVPEAVGRADSITALLEVAVIASILVQLRGSPAPGPARGRLPMARTALARLATALALVVITTGTAVGMTPDGAHAAAHEAAIEVREGEAMTHDAADGHHDEAPGGHAHTP